MSLAVGGWSLTWAEGVGVVDLGPPWIPAAAFFLGLMLIPLARFRRREAPAAGAVAAGTPSRSPPPEVRRAA